MLRRSTSATLHNFWTYVLIKKFIDKQSTHFRTGTNTPEQQTWSAKWMKQSVSRAWVVIYLLNHTGIWQWHTRIMHTIWTIWWCWWKIFRTSCCHSSIIITPLLSCIQQHLVLQTPPDLSEDWTTLVHLSPHKDPKRGDTFYHRERSLALLIVKTLHQLIDHRLMDFYMMRNASSNRYKCLQDTSYAFCNLVKGLFCFPISTIFVRMTPALPAMSLAV